MSSKIAVFWIVQEEAVNDFQGQQFVDLGRVVPISFEMALYHGLDPFSFDIRPGKTARVEQHFPNVSSEGIPVPDPEMEDLVPSEEETFEAQRRENMVHAGHPLGHSHVVGVFRLEQKLEQSPGKPPLRDALCFRPSRGQSGSAEEPAFPSAINRRETSLVARADSGARKTVRTKSLSRKGDRMESCVCSSASIP